MEHYNFLADLLQTYRDLPDSIKALWIITPPAFTLALIALLRPRPPAPPQQQARTLYRSQTGLLVSLPEPGQIEQDLGKGTERVEK